MNRKLIITPKTRVMDLIEEYPQLEETLVSFVPAFKKIRNPILRKTIARVATLQQAASIANIKVDELVNRLRKEIGQDLTSDSQGESGYNTERPGWFSEDLIAERLDAGKMLAVGEHPVGQVIADLNKMDRGSIYELKAPFLPAPLIDKATSLGAAHWVKREGADVYFIYFCKE